MLSCAEMIASRRSNAVGLLCIVLAFACSDRTTPVTTGAGGSGSEGGATTAPASATASNTSSPTADSTGAEAGSSDDGLLFDLGSPTDSGPTEPPPPPTVDCRRVPPQDTGVVVCVYAPGDDDPRMLIPAAGADVRIEQASDERPGHWNVLHELVTDEAGVVRLDNVEPADVRIRGNTPIPPKLGCWYEGEVTTELFDDGAVIGLVLPDGICT